MSTIPATVGRPTNTADDRKTNCVLGTIAIWDMEFYNPDFDYPAKQPSFPAAEIFAIWLLQMYDLTYVPYLTE